jgi:hypothetical protein
MVRMVNFNLSILYLASLVCISIIIINPLTSELLFINNNNLKKGLDTMSMNSNIQARPYTPLKDSELFPFTSRINHSEIWHSAMVDESGFERVSQTYIDKFESNAGKKLALVVFSNHWYTGISFPSSMANIAKQNDAVPIIRMGPWKSNGLSLLDAGPYTMTNIAKGQHDTALKEWAKQAKDFGSPILVDFGYEANNNYFPWSKQGASAYIDAYRHIINLFRQQSTTNVYFVYHPDLGSNPNNMKQWYPGDEYIDWILASAYGDDGNIGSLGVLQKYYGKLAAISASKPLGIEEWGIGSPKDTKDTLDALAQNKFPGIKILSIWNEAPIGAIEDRRIDKSPEMLNAYRTGIANPIYLSSGFNPNPIFK